MTNKISNLVLRLPNKLISYLLIYRLYQKLDHCGRQNFLCHVIIYNIMSNLNYCSNAIINKILVNNLCCIQKKKIVAQLYCFNMHIILNEQIIL